MSWNYLALRKQTTGNQSRYQSQGGFGIIELIISISIMTIVATIILVKQSSFNGSMLLRSEAYDLALQIREVQLSAVSPSGDVAPGTFRSVLGLNFNTANDGIYHVFRDANEDYTYDTAEEFGLQGIIDPRFEIRIIRVMDTTPYESTGGLSIIFERPNFDAQFYSSTGTEIIAPSVEIVVARRDADPADTGPGAIRTVEVTASGQISVQ